MLMNGNNVPRSTLTPATIPLTMYNHLNMININENIITLHTEHK